MKTGGGPHCVCSLLLIEPNGDFCRTDAVFLFLFTSKIKLKVGGRSGILISNIAESEH
jgi:hypothetical protein